MYQRARVYVQLDRLDAYATAHRLPKQLKHRLLHYYRNLYAMHTAFNEEELFERLPCGLRQELAVAILDESLLA